MFLAFAELRRSKARFALLAGAVGLLAFLILAQQALRDSLLDSFVGGIRSQSAEVLVFNVDGRRFLQSSAITSELESAVRSTDGVGAVGRLWQGTFPVTADGEVTAAAVAGYDVEGVGSPGTIVEGRLPAAPGEVVSNQADADRGFAVGDVITVEPAGLRLDVVGLAGDAGLNVSPTVWTTAATYLDIARTRNPGLTDELRPNALAVRPADGSDPGAVAERLNAADPDIDALTASDAAARNPAVRSIQQSFGIIFVLFAAVVPLVVGLFFLIITTQKAPTLTLLRAVGAPGRRLGAGVLLQVGVVLGVGLTLAVAAYAAFASQRIDGLAVGFDGTAVAAWTAALLVLGLVSAVASVRRVLAVEPAAALAGGDR
jgi:putative ABC transport system permease protein